MKLTVNIPGNEYEIIIEENILKGLKDYVNLDRKVLIVTDDKVPCEYANEVAKSCREPLIVTVKSGEESKSMESFSMLQSKMLKNGFSRKDLVIAVGGGVVGDLAGFSASCYMRGIDFYNVPTTVLSQVDSSIGGKTAINHQGVKNVVGTFYQPKAVFIDPVTRATLPERQIANGMAEALKMAATMDRNLFFDILEMKEEEDLTPYITRAIEIKRKVVEQDEKELGLRRVLNFGHTLGHGIEVAAGGNLYHGEAIALGMLAMCSGEVRQLLETALEKLGLPTSYEFDENRAIEAISHDKKLHGSTICTVTVEEIGSYRFEDMTVEQLKERLKRI
ncbi:MAG: 3-dehydroquinate synthase [Lachnospiraceae bacterium]|nr:3-dehydroquinate synthase [Lachnospiraceae bacterium]